MTKFSETHEWVAVDGDMATVGITDYAQRELGDIVYAELPKIGQELSAGREACVLESTKAAADVYSPISGVVIAVNERLATEVELINREAENSGWLFKLRIKNPAEFKTLLDKDAYLAMLK